MSKLLILIACLYICSCSLDFAVGSKTADLVAMGDVLCRYGKNSSLYSLVYTLKSNIDNYHQIQFNCISGDTITVKEQDQ